MYVYLLVFLFFLFRPLSPSYYPLSFPFIVISLLLFFFIPLPMSASLPLLTYFYPSISLFLSLCFFLLPLSVFNSLSLVRLLFLSSLYSCIISPWFSLFPFLPSIISLLSPVISLLAVYYARLALAFFHTYFAVPEHTLLYFHSGFSYYTYISGVLVIGVV